MLVERVDDELAQRGEDALAAERPQDQIGVDPFDVLEIDHTVGMRGDRTKAHALGDEIDFHIGAAGARLRHRVGALGVQIGGHLARQQLDQAVAEQCGRMAFAGECRIDRVELGALEAFGDEFIGDHIGAAAFDRVVVAAEAGIGVRPAGAGEHRIDADLAQRRHDRLRRLRSPGPVLADKLAFEQHFAARDQVGERRRPRRRDGVEIDMRREYALVPTRAGRRASARQQRQRRDGAEDLRSDRHVTLPWSPRAVVAASLVRAVRLARMSRSETWHRLRLDCRADKCRCEFAPGQRRSAPHRPAP